MACVVVYPNPMKPKPGRPLWHMLKGQLDGKPCCWSVTVWYDVPEQALEYDEILGIREKNPRKLSLRVDKPSWLHDVIREVIDPEMAAEAERIRAIVPDGKITNIKWQAVQER